MAKMHIAHPDYPELVLCGRTRDGVHRNVVPFDCTWLEVNDCRTCLQRRSSRLLRPPNPGDQRTPASGVPLRHVVGPVLDVLERCQGYEYYYDAYYGPDAPFSDERPEPEKVAEALQDLCRSVPAAIRHLSREREELLALADKTGEQLSSRVRFLESKLRDCLSHIDLLEGHLPMVNTEDEAVYKASLEFGERIADCLPNTTDHQAPASGALVHPVVGRISEPGDKP